MTLPPNAWAPYYGSPSSCPHTAENGVSSVQPHLLVLQPCFCESLLGLGRLPLRRRRPGRSVCSSLQVRLSTASTAAFERQMGTTIYRSPAVPAAYRLMYLPESTTLLHWRRVLYSMMQVQMLATSSRCRAAASTASAACCAASTRRSAASYRRRTKVRKTSQHCLGLDCVLHRRRVRDAAAAAALVRQD